MILVVPKMYKVFHCCVITRLFMISVAFLEIDHKPLVPLSNNKSLDNFPSQILRFRLRLMRFDYIYHQPCTPLMN